MTASVFSSWPLIRTATSLAIKQEKLDTHVTPANQSTVVSPKSKKLAAKSNKKLNINKNTIKKLLREHSSDQIMAFSAEHPRKIITVWRRMHNMSISTHLHTYYRAFLEIEVEEYKNEVESDLYKKQLEKRISDQVNELNKKAKKIVYTKQSTVDDI